MKVTAAVAFVLACLAGIPTLASAMQPAPDRASQIAPRDRQDENRWRYVWHNDRWWYWTADERWLYYNGRRWMNYDPRSPASGRLAAGYRKAPAFEKPPAAAPRPPHSWPAVGAESQTELLNSFYLEGRPTTAEGKPLGGESQSVFGGLGSALGGGNGLGRTYGGGERTVLPTPADGSAARTGGGGFGGPQGSSLGAGSAAGGASTPR